MALQLGKTVAELMSQLSNQELIEWMAYYNIDPWGGYRSDLQTADIKSCFVDGASADNLLLYDPNPLPPHIIEKRQKAELQAKLERQTQQMAQLFEIND